MKSDFICRHGMNNPFAMQEVPEELPIMDDAPLPIEERMEHFEAFATEMAKTLRMKNSDYTAGKKDEDSLYNFRALAKLMEGAPITPYTVVMIYMLKHTFSLLTFAKTGIQESGEGLRGRHIDQANYTFLLNELVEEHAAICKKRKDSKCEDPK